MVTLKLSKKLTFKMIGKEEVTEIWLPDHCDQFST